MAHGLGGRYGTLDVGQGKYDLLSGTAQRPRTLSGDVWEVCWEGAAGVVWHARGHGWQVWQEVRLGRVCKDVNRGRASDIKEVGGRQASLSLAN